MMDGMMGGCGGMVLWSLLLLALIVVGVWLVARALRGPEGHPGSDGPSALQILEERFARGEIDRDEFEDRRRTLRS